MTIEIKQVKCACDKCICIVPVESALQNDGRMYCSETCANGHPNGKGCGCSTGCNCG